MPKKARAGARRERTGRAARRHHWSGEVTRRSSALALEPAVFKQGSSRAIAASLKRSADRSRRRKAGPYQSAMSMLNFYVNRAGRSLSGEQKTRLEKAKQELRRLYGRDSTRGQAR